MPLEYTLLSTKETPPGHFRVTIKETGYTVQHYAWDAFRNAYESHCLANNIPLSPLWEEELKDRLCRENLPSWANYCKRVGKFKHPHRINFGALMTFLRVVRDWLKGGGKFVEREEAERRANICLTCPYNSKTIGFSCGGCGNSFFSGLSAVMGKEMKTSVSESLGSCGLCGCALKAAVFVPLDIQQNAMDEATKQLFRDPQVQSYCWKSQGV